MNIIYWTVTSVFKSETGWAQLCHVKGNLTSREFQNCEILTTKGMNSLPKEGDLVALAEIHNSEVIVLGVLESFDLSLESGEVLLHNGTVIKDWQIDTYNLQAKLKIDKDNNLELSTGSTAGWVFTSVCSIKILANGNIEMSSTGNISLTAWWIVEIL